MEQDTKRHPIFDISLGRNGSRVFSTFRTEAGLRIDVRPYLKTGDPFIAVELGDIQNLRDGGLVYRKELFRIYLDGRCTLRPQVEIDSITGGRISMEGMGGFRERQYTNEDIFNHRHSFIGKWLPHPIRAVLDTVAGWIEDPKTVRVDPYDFDKILPEENTPYDEELARIGGFIDETVTRIQHGEFTIKPSLD